jgi:hypothetical protein
MDHYTLGAILVTLGTIVLTAVLAQSFVVAGAAGAIVLGIVYLISDIVIHITKALK